MYPIFSQLLRLCNAHRDKINALIATAGTRIDITSKLPPPSLVRTKLYLPLLAETTHTDKTKKDDLVVILSAVRRGLEPLTPCVTGTYSNQLN